MNTSKTLLAMAFALGLGLANAADHPELSEADKAYSEEDFVKAAALYRKDAELHVIVAQVNLAFMYLDGQGIPQDYPQAAKWFLAAAVQGNAEAQQNLGVLCQEGKGVDQNPVEAAKWFHIAGAVSSLEAIEKTMTPEQIAESRKRADEWIARFEQSKGH
jgi:TPR repeat protein